MEQKAWEKEGVFFTDEFGYARFCVLSEDKFKKEDIEKYPFRLFVVRKKTSEGEEHSKNNFLDARICFLKEDEFNEKLKELEPSDFKLWLYGKWIVHMLKKTGKNEINKNKIKKIWLYLSTEFKSDSSDSNIDVPLTCPSLAKRVGSTSSDKKWYELDGIEFILSNENPGKDEEPECFIIKYQRHKVKGNKGDYKYEEKTSGSQHSFPLLFRVFNDSYESKFLRFLLIENSLWRIYIEDERFLEFYNRLDENRKKYFEDIYIKVEEVIRNNKNIENSYPFSIYVVHQGILDKYVGSDREEIKKKIVELKERFPFVLITTGRGKPANFPACEKLLPFSVLDFLMKDYPEKFLFVNIACSIVAREEGG